MEHKTLFDTIKSEEEDGESRYVTCDECDTQVDCYNDNINIVYKGGDSVNNPYEELVLCTMCFQDMKDELIQQDYLCDDWDIEEEEEEEETLEEYLKEKEIDRISNGECPTISHESYLSRLTSEQKEVEKEKQIQFDIWLKEYYIQQEKQVKQDEEDDLIALKIEKMQEAFTVLIAHEDRKKEKESGEEEEEEEEEEQEEEEEEEEQEEEEEEEEEVEEASLSDADVQQGKYSKTDLHQLCVNMDCDQYPPDWDFEEDTEETYQQDQWKKCCICDGYFNDDGMGDILYVQEQPNNQEAECSLCGKSDDVVQMKGSGQYLCGNACDESDEDTEED